MTTTWEYQILKQKLTMKGFDYPAIEQQLNDLGKDGWEAFDTVTPSFGNGQSIDIGVLLKRPRPAGA
ncbi:hypothetical protein GCM10025867_25400 [Frondihabitans sucicola]|uniref:DUF4177 domain-containing protein n=1 Tax=Frondihabitans sucicola TaxID=1268041 RepID=A0ABN6XZ52_9MICO|nr:DUF4177 domain-containing protein [Frondihabitans sucicola]BDZ50299.1 hypothetical protein GCM10025867_25400 [Frondihabitans sucicola]